jgi:hypothetical protein
MFRRCFSTNLNLANELERYSLFKPTPLSLRSFIDFGSKGVGIEGTERNSCLFLRTELPVRLARLLKLFDSARPVEFSAMPSALLVRSWYLKSFEEALSCPSIEV